MPSPNSKPIGMPAHRPAGAEISGRRIDRQVPDMQVVTKGSWTLQEERRPVEELEKEDREERKQN
jgi:hypothetical protein